MIQDKVEEWMTVIFEQGRAINGIKLKETTEGTLEISGFGYPLTLAEEVSQLGEGEQLLYEFPTGYYYGYNQENGTVRLLEEEVKSIHSDDEIAELTEEEFQTILEERYDNLETNAETVSGFGGSENSSPSSMWIYSSIGIGAVILSLLALFLLRRRTLRRGI